MQAFSALCTGAAAGAVGTYHMYHAVWKSRDHVAESSSMYVQQHDPTGRQLPPKRLHDEVSKKFTERWNKAVLGLHSLLTDMLTGAPK